MGRLDDLLPAVQHAEEQREKAEVEAEIAELSACPDDMPSDVWALVQENGRVATEKLNLILNSPKFMRMRAGDQARLIALAQNRAYGTPKTNRGGDGAKRRGMVDVTQGELNNLVSRATLPEYKKQRDLSEAEDAVILKPN